MITPRFDVFRHGYGRPIVQRGPMAGCVNFPQHRHEKLNRGPVGFARAKALADADANHVQVYQRLDGIAAPHLKAYDNGKAPFTPPGWVEEVWRGGRY